MSNGSWPDNTINHVTVRARLESVREITTGGRYVTSQTKAAIEQRVQSLLTLVDPTKQDVRVLEIDQALTRAVQAITVGNPGLSEELFKGCLGELDDALAVA